MCFLKAGHPQNFLRVDLLFLESWSSSEFSEDPQNFLRIDLFLKVGHPQNFLRIDLLFFESWPSSEFSDDLVFCFLKEDHSQNCLRI